ncbi:MAG: imidazoleglycerol-phosphate dehydratase HisB [Candidatus Binatia bacterium]
MEDSEKNTGGESPVRKASVRRETSETSINVELSIDGSGNGAVDTGIPFLDHMLDTFARHSLVDLTIRAKGDLHIDDHHTVEDIGLALGQALDQALDDKRGIRRFGHAEVPLDEALVSVSVDLSGRPYLAYNLKIRHHRVGDFETELVNDFMQALMTEAKMNLHVNKRYGRNPHHLIEAAFKALARALGEACSRDPRVTGVPSTKGSLKG